MGTHTIRIAVLYATAQGSTRGIAEFIGSQLTGRGAAVEIADVEHAPDLSGFDAVVLGSAVHNMAWLPSAAEFVNAHRDEFTARDTWLFSVGLGPALRGPHGRWFGRQVPSAIAALRDSITPRDYTAFAGRMERAGSPLWARLVYLAMGGGRYGDLRDWDAVRAWSERIAHTLRLPQSITPSSHQ
ncbi:flavodoxin domain-containing protein [Nocardia crassostreae]|uniref:flavodoxin domain-containing protein n=1 Tax=Nocardia crassostreae TaxID=53428 RepID=UPI00082BCBEA|nr:flavodoxin domain-containing protein [Nocardia crassostreae]